MKIVNDKLKRTIGITTGIVFIVIVVPILVVFFFMVLNASMLKQSIALQEVVFKWKKEIAVLTVCVYGLAFYYGGQYFMMKKPKKSTQLASQRWSTKEELKHQFRQSPLQQDEYDQIF